MFQKFEMNYSLNAMWSDISFSTFAGTPPTRQLSDFMGAKPVRLRAPQLQPLKLAGGSSKLPR